MLAVAFHRRVSLSQGGRRFAGIVRQGHGGDCRCGGSLPARHRLAGGRRFRHDADQLRRAFGRCRPSRRRGCFCGTLGRRRDGCLLRCSGRRFRLGGRRGLGADLDAALARGGRRPALRRSSGFAARHVLTTTHIAPLWPGATGPAGCCRDRRSKDWPAFKCLISQVKGFTGWIAEDGCERACPDVAGWARRLPEAVVPRARAPDHRGGVDPGPAPPGDPATSCERLSGFGSRGWVPRLGPRCRSRVSLTAGPVAS